MIVVGTAVFASMPITPTSGWVTVGVKLATWKLAAGKLKLKNLRASASTPALNTSPSMIRRPASAPASQACCRRTLAV